MSRTRVLTRERLPQGGATPLFIAAGNGYLEVAKLLLAAGADKNAAATKVREGRGGEGVLGARTVLLSVWGSHGGC